MQEFGDIRRYRDACEQLKTFRKLCSADLRAEAKKKKEFEKEEQKMKELEECNNIDIQIICEPKGRDSAPAICIASLLGSKDDFTFILPCDHVFDDDEFSRCCMDSLKYLDDSIQGYWDVYFLFKII